jgi:hypothetical protein
VDGLTPLDYLPPAVTKSKFRQQVRDLLEGKPIRKRHRLKTNIQALPEHIAMQHEVDIQLTLKSIHDKLILRDISLSEALDVLGWETGADITLE